MPFCSFLFVSYVWSCCTFRSVYLCALLSRFSHVQLCKPMDWSLPVSSVHGIFQARALEWVAVPSSKRSSQPIDWTHVSCVSCINRWFFATTSTWEAPVYLNLSQISFQFQFFHCISALFSSLETIHDLFSLNLAHISIYPFKFSIFLHWKK